MEALPFLAALHASQEGADGCDFSFGFEEFCISVCELNVTQLPRLKPRSPGDMEQIRCQRDDSNDSSMTSISKFLPEKGLKDLILKVYQLIQVDTTRNLLRRASVVHKGAACT